MGDFFQVIVDLDAEATEAVELAVAARAVLQAAGIIGCERADNVLGGPQGLGFVPGPRFRDVLRDRDEGRKVLGLSTNGYHEIVGRTVFHSGQGEPVLQCPRCGHVPPWRHWIDKVDEWWGESGPALVACPACGHTAPLARWDGNWAFAHLGFRFWNWPPLNGEVQRLLATPLGSHRLKVVAGRS